ncbi:MAG TPA: imidazole glycerol phosphate synthase subunit HisH, partial [Anaerolineales bacterium]|nr:imidazole glycerol phosphate synthase subunit HisH [Anaerolineales bacterium]
MTNHIALIDHGVGNLRSVEKALAAVGANVVLTREADVIAAAEKIVLPGVGAFGDCMRGLHASNLVQLITQLAGERPFL